MATFGFSFMCPTFYSYWSPWFVYQVRKQIATIPDGVPYEVIVATHLPIRLYKDIPNLVYIKTSKEISIGKKRNLICDRAKYDIIFAMDDDDAYPAYRLQASVEALQKHKIEMLSCDKFVCYNFLEPNLAFQWDTFSESCLCFTKGFWKRNKFGDVSLCEGNGMIKNKEPFFKSNILLTLAFTHMEGKRHSKHKLALPCPDITHFPHLEKWEVDWLCKRFGEHHRVFFT